jgi:6-phosphogluconolactonase (cycloisomerase 2 family)
VCARGNDAAADRAEDPGALKLFRLDGGSFRPASQFPYAAGLGPRHLDIHPAQPWLYVSMERGNKLCVHRLDENGTIAPQILFTRSTLADEGSDKRRRQLAGTIHIHPAGSHVYVANRADGVVRDGETDVFEGGENNIAVFRIDGQTGEPALVEHVDTHGIHPRTFSLDPSGRLLVVGNLMTRRVRDGNAITTVPVALALFRVRADGRLEFARKYDLDSGNKTPFWTGMV